MMQSFIKSVGLAPLDAYVEPRISIGNAVPDREISTGNFSIQVDAEARALIIKNNKGRVIWKSLHNLPFLSSSLGTDEMTTAPYNDALYKITEHDEHPTRLQTITRIETSLANKNQVRIMGGLGTKIVPPTHLNYEFVLTELSPTQLEFSANILNRDPAMKDYRRLMITFESRKEEDFYGFGEQFYYGSLKGHKVPILVRERGHGRGGPLQATFFSSAASFVEGYFSGDDGYCSSTISVPQYVTTDKRCLFLETSEYTSFNLCEPDRVTIRVENSQVKGRIIDGESMLDLLTEYTSYCGRMKPLPDWINEGVVAGIQGGSNKVREVVRELKRHGVPLAAVWITDWTGQREQQLTKNVTLRRLWWNWEPDAVSYPDWSSLVQELGTDQNIRTLSYITPLLVSKPGARRDLYREAAERQFMVRAPTLGPYVVECGGLQAGMIDLTNPDAWAWFKEVLKEHVWKDGISGMMVDYGEELPYDMRKIMLKDNKPSSTYHNLYPEMWAQLHREVIQELTLPEDDAVIFFRAGFTRSPRHASLFWTGDHNVSWDMSDGLKGALAGMLSGGFSGFTLNHSDVGGYNTIEGQLKGASMQRSRELLYRWMELGAFSAVFRTHEGILPERNAQFYENDDTYAHFGHMARLYVALAPYRKHLMSEAHEKGWPLMRHLVLYYPSDPVAQEVGHQQFLFGAHVMVAPTLSPATTYVKVYFPREGRDVTWRHIWTGKYFEGNGTYKTVDTPLGQPAVFIKEPRQDNGLLNNLVDFANANATYTTTLK
ncbi:glycosyl hydrolases family 31-domain-containing protein [Dichotomocladium elegans]|nr:glycosyl hydrolases family 31-domain-containing protein [Dichotomocladium elegans]